VTHLVANESSIYSAHSDGTLKRSVRIEPNTFSNVATVKLDSFLLSLVASKTNTLFGLNSKQQLLVLDSETLAEIKRVDLKSNIGGNDPTFLAHSVLTNELWVGDKKGLIHILDSDSLEKTHTIEKKHNNGITTMTSSRDGNLIASGDSYRYIYVFNT
jgi:WD40 repeat protein